MIDIVHQEHLAMLTALQKSHGHGSIPLLGSSSTCAEAIGTQPRGGKPRLQLLSNMAID